MRLGADAAPRRPASSPPGLLDRLKARCMGYLSQVWKVVALFFGSIVSPQEPAQVTGGGAGGSGGSKPKVNRINPGGSSHTQFGNDDGDNDFMRRGRMH
mmetsp:Transcript_57218/g.153177  ORF Transcript_57218/g.153177 Transcript_57218/m.153177 type:complete len:99 (+) Transcript_57218:69-365(+)